ncbi:putative N-acetyltransferase (TIGR04045 family) [Kribbella orskensis]|uniref:N-acetyltransferase (TIGR04045 family) n=1 Tax=Kribbella orskensis TaxID=2512216 RepID=A0ABY2BKD1_9ACTN|nr:MULTISPECIES: MSMEG_0567/sll0787 family protein [Kribbella]TCN38891.1 putative N-acetyltransferase (TIGR04045 family) [Kribbella sp. VKM Ac-2500]TCO21072.1 putative N-acetyltransferase (TIGR04045 family) [Kribbella orskensis]
MSTATEAVPQQAPVVPRQLTGARRAADVLALLGDPVAAQPSFLIEEAADTGAVRSYRELRRRAFVEDQGLFDGSDLDERDEDPRTIVLVARDLSGVVIGGVRLGPAMARPDIGWWQGGRLVRARTSSSSNGVGAALVRAACARAEAAGALRFDATVQTGTHRFFQRLGWETVRPVEVAGTPHVLMRWPIGRIAQLVAATKSDLGPLLQGIGPAGFIGDDGAPVPGSDLVAACDAIVPSLVERDPEWAGWCSVLVNVNDLAAMGAEPVGLLDAIGARDRSFATRILSGLRQAAQAYGVPVLGGHTQFGVPAALSVTALGRADRPVPGGGGRPGDAVRLTADVGGGWRPGYAGRQWDSTTHRSGAELRLMTKAVKEAQPAAAKDVSMAGAVGTLGMLAEASGCAAVLEVADIPKPATASMGDWLTCFPGFAMLTAGSRELRAGPAQSSACGQLIEGQGVSLRWPDGEVTEAVAAGVTGMGAA